MTIYRETSGQLTQAKEKPRVLRGVSVAQKDLASGPALTGRQLCLLCVPGLLPPLLYIAIDLGKHARFSGSKDPYHHNPGLSAKHQ